MKGIFDDPYYHARMEDLRRVAYQFQGNNFCFQASMFLIGMIHGEVGKDGWARISNGSERLGALCRDTIIGINFSERELRLKGQEGNVYELEQNALLRQVRQLARDNQICPDDYVDSLLAQFQ